MSKPKPARTFVVQPGRSLALPTRYGSAPGGGAATFRAGDTIEIPAGLVDRFVRGRVTAGDLVEVKAPSAAERKPAATPTKE